MQKDDELKILRKSGDGGADFAPTLIPLHLLVRPAGERRSLLQDQQVRLIGRCVEPLRRSLGEAQRSMPGHRVQPGAEPLRVVKLRQSLEREQQRVLRDVVRCVRTHDPGRDRSDGGPVATDQLVKGVHLTQRGRFCEGGVVHAAPRHLLHLALLLRRPNSDATLERPDSSARIVARETRTAV